MLWPEARLLITTPPMSNTDHVPMRSFARRVTTTILRPALLRWTGIFVLFAAALSAPAATFFSDFNSGLPSGTAVYGNSAILPTTGYTNSGCLLLTPNIGSQVGGFLISNDLDAGNPVYGFVAQFKAFIGGGTAADGIAFNFANDLPDAATGVEGAGTGLTVEFDTYDNGLPDEIGIDVKVGGNEVATFPFGGIRQNAWVDVLIQLHPDGTLDVTYDGNWIYRNLNVASLGFPVPYTGGRFGFGAFTGGSYDTQAIDNLNVSTVTNQGPFVDSYSPIGRVVRPDAPTQILLTDYATQVDTNTIVLKLDGSPIVPTVLTQAPPQTTILYIPSSSAYLAPGSSHTVSLTFADNSTPTPITNTLQWSFTVGTFTALPTNLVVDPSFVSLGSPGFSIRYSQVADLGARDIARAESQLAGLLIDNFTGLPFVNLAAPNPADASFTLHETNVINYGYPAGSTGDFPGDTDVPGVPGPSTGNGSSYAMDAVTYLHLSPGFYSLGVNSSDGFKLTVADGADVFAPQEAIVDGVRAAADTTVPISVALDGYYPFRLVYFTGDPTYGPAPGTATPNVEFFNIDKNGNKVLINDTNVVGYVPAFTAAKTRPYVRSISPDAGDSGVPGNATVSMVLVDGTLTVVTNSIGLWFNGAAVSPIVSGNAGITTVTYDPPGDLVPNSTNTVELAFTDSGSARRTNSWQFFAANIFQQIWSIAPAATAYVTSGSTERGLAHNPKTDHVLLVSRATAVGGLEVEVLSSSNGSKLGTLDITGIAAGPGLFKLNLIDVADDGVIYACDLTTDSTANNFVIYRWDNEAAVPTVAYSANPAGALHMRIGDTLRVRGSGAGTQIIATENTAIAANGIGGTNAMLFTTVDGTNFIATRIGVPEIVSGDLRLGLAFGCGDVFYGAVTASGNSQMRYVSFDRATGAATLLNTYLLNNPGSATVGPLGVDLLNQRVIGNATSGTAAIPHSMNLYDLSSLAPSPAVNLVLDRRVFGTANAAFGTGAVDFTPDGSRLFTLDTANGILAFSLNPKIAALTICAQPRTNIVAGIGSLGFMDATAIGAPQKYQWRFHGTNPLAAGTPILNATNRTLDIYNVQQSQLGYYSVVISNTALLSSVTSSVAPLDTQMVVTNQPASQVIAVGGAATLTVGVSNGVAPFSYQWKLNGADVGANSSSYNVNNAQVANAGVYTVVITDSLGQSVTSAQASLTVGTLGNGTGLLGDYYSDQPKTFVDPPTLERLDSTVNFDWGIGSPDASISADTFTVRWTGLVEPLYSQTYTFYTATDDGARLWVNGQLLVDKWVDQGNIEWSGTIALTAHQKYPILMEYYENAGAAAAKLSWSSLGQVKQVIPQTQLYPVTSFATAAQPLITRTANGTSLTITWAGSYMLLSAPSPEGPWTQITGATSPYPLTIDPAQPEMFLRLQSQ
jgi:hypothetical protein